MMITIFILLQLELQEKTNKTWSFEREYPFSALIINLTLAIESLKPPCEHSQFHKKTINK